MSARSGVVALSLCADGVSLLHGSTQSGNVEQALAPIATVNTAATRNSLVVITWNPIFRLIRYTSPVCAFQAKLPVKPHEIF
jgi:hypothetical protein